jgi:DNA-binding transcriptional regulator YbjK
MHSVSSIEATTVDLIERLRKRAEIRRQIPTRKSVIENKPDRISDLLEEAANELHRLKELDDKKNN